MSLLFVLVLLFKEVSSACWKDAFDSPPKTNGTVCTVDVCSSIVVSIDQNLTINSDAGTVKLCGKTDNSCTLMTKNGTVNTNDKTLPTQFTYCGDVKIYGILWLVGRRTVSIKSCHGDIVINSTNAVHVYCTDDKGSRENCLGTKTCANLGLKRIDDLKKYVVLHYSFQNVTGKTVIDESGHGNNADMLNVSTHALNYTRCARGMVFNTEFLNIRLSKDWLNTSHLTSTNFDLTIAVWVWIPEVKRHQLIFTSFYNKTKRYRESQLFHFGIRRNGSMRWFMADADTPGSKTKLFNVVVIRPTLKPRQWHHVAVTYTYSKGRNNGRIYINGTVRQLHATYGRLPKNMPNRIGWSPKIGSIDSDKPFVGIMHDFFIFNKALNSTELRELMKLDQRDFIYEDGGGGGGGRGGGRRGRTRGTKSIPKSIRNCHQSVAYSARHAHINRNNTSILLGGNPGCYGREVFGQGGGAIELIALNGKIMIGSVINASGEGSLTTGGGGGSIRLSANQVEVNGNGKLITDGGSGSRHGSGGGGIIQILVNSSLQLDENVIFLRGGTGPLPGRTGFTLMQQTTANLTRSSTTKPVYPTEELYWPVPCKSYTFGTLKDGNGIYRLQKAKYDDKVTLKCYYGPRHVAMQAHCVYPWKTTVAMQWRITNQEHCWSRSLFLAKFAEVCLRSAKRPYLSDYRLTLFEPPSIMNVSASNVASVTRQLRNLTNEAETFNCYGIGNTSLILEKIANVGLAEQRMEEVADDFYNTVNNLLNANETMLLICRIKTNRIIKTIKNFSEKRAFPDEDHPSYTNLTNLAISLWAVKSRKKAFSTVFAKRGNGGESEASRNSHTKTFSVSLRVPNAVLNYPVGKKMKVLFILYRRTGLFKTRGQYRTNVRIKSDQVIAVSVPDERIANVDKAIIIRYPVSKQVNVTNGRCVFWDFQANQRRGDWATTGCKLLRNERDEYDECHCNHATNFAMLLDVNPEKNMILNKHKRPLSIISYIGCSLSLLGILLTISTMFLFREMFATISSKIFLNVCIALAAALFVFLAAAERSKTSSDSHCVAAGIMIHYFFLVVMAWMVLEAYTMYLAFVKVYHMAALEDKIPRLWICCLICWGIPAIIVAITASVAHDSYGNEEYCVIQGMPMIVAFFTPVAGSILVNTVTFLFILRSLLKSGTIARSTQKTSRVEQARRGVAISVFLGLTWISGALAVGNAKLIFQYIFCITNSLQGWMIFLFYCVLSTEVREKFRKRFFTKRFGNERARTGSGTSGLEMRKLAKQCSSEKTETLALSTADHEDGVWNGSKPWKQASTTF